MTPALLVAAVEALAAAAPVVTGSGSGLLPDVEDVREISVQIARNVIKKAVEDGLAEEWIREQMWNAEYRPLELVSDKEADAYAKGEMGTGSQQREARF
jgi:malate dehydrogenase (oxaloacetate-decarboxylating)